MKTFLVIAILSLAIGVLIWANWPEKSLQAGTLVDKIVIEKSKRSLILYNKGIQLKAYPVSLGRIPVGAKEKEGDQKTPEGIYRVIDHKLDSRFHRALRISYPEKKDYQNALSSGVNIGSNIMIHGIRNGLGFIGKVHLWMNWTSGCVALTNPEIEEIFNVVKDSTEIEIRK